MATELAAAYVAIIPSLKGASKQISSQLAGMNLAPAGRSMGKNLTANISKGMRLQEVGQKIQGVSKQIGSVGSSLTNSITKPAIGAATAVGGIAVALGFKRLVGIDTARAKLKALGHDAESIQTIMDSALDSVKGTAFGLGDAANIAASAVAANVKPGKELTKYLTMTADAAAIAGIGLSEMGYILNQVQTGQVAYTDSLNMIADRGIPIYQWLADELGVAAGEVKKFASDGKISSEDFFNAINKNIGGAAKVVGENSFTGAWDNLKASLGRLGASFLDAGGKGGGFFSQLKPLMTDLTGDIDSLGPAAERLGVKFGQAFTKMVDKVKELKEQWDGLSKDQQSTILKLAGAAVALGPVLKIVGSLGSGVGSIITMMGSLSGAGGVAGLSGKFLKVFGVVGLVAGAVVLLWQNSDKFRASLESAGEKLGTVFSDTKEKIQPVVDQISKELGPALEKAGDSVGEMVTSAMPAIEQFVGLIGDLVVILGPVIEKLLPGLGAQFQSVGQIISEAFNTVSGALQDIRKQWADVATGVKAIANGDWSQAWESAKSIVARNFLGMEKIIRGFGRILGTILTMPARAAVAMFGKQFVEARKKLSAAFEAMKITVRKKVAEIVADVKSLPRKIVAAIPGPGGLLVRVGASIMDGFKNGLTSKFKDIQSSLQGLTAKIPSWKGPKKKDKTLLTPAGKTVIEGFKKGLESGYSGVRDSLKKLTSDIAAAQEKAVAKEADRIVAARKKANAKIRKANEGKKNKQKLLPTISKAEAEKQAKKNLGITKAQTKAANKLISAQRKATKGIWDDGKYKGSVSRWQGMNAGTTNLLRSLTANGNWRKTASGAGQKVATSQIRKATLADIGKAQTQVQAMLDKTRETLTQMKDARAQLKNQIADSIKGELDLTAGLQEATLINGRYVNGHLDRGGIVRNTDTFASVAGNVKSMAAKAKKFAQRLQALVKKGIPQGLVQEVASLGTENGIRVADALLSGTSAQVKQLSADYSSLNSWSSKAGDYVAGQMYDVGINAAEGIIKGLEKDQKKLENAAKKIAGSLTKAVKKALGIKSPSRVFRDEVGVMVDRGLAIGIAGGEAERAADGLAAGIQAPFKNVNPAASGLAGGEPVGGRNFTDADIEALARVMAGVSVVWAPSNREMAKFAQKSTTELEKLR